MKYSIRFLVSKEIKEKFHRMQEAGINVSQILRKFLLDFPLETDNK